jgi:hypothetical protein
MRVSTNGLPVAPDIASLSRAELDLDQGAVAQPDRNFEAQQY